MTEEPVTVTAVGQDGCLLLACNHCGPLGVSPSREIAKVVSQAHMRTKHLITWTVTK